MNTELKDILIAVRRTLRLVDKPEKAALIFASGIMVITGFLTNLPAVILGQLVDKLTVGDSFSFSSVVPFILLIIGIILVREALTVWRKYNVENVATQTEKKQTVATIAHILEADNSSLDTMRVGTLHGRMFRSVEGLIKIIKLSFLEFLPTIFVALTALAIAMIQKPLIATVMLLVIPAGLFIIAKQISSQKGIRVKLLRGKEKIDGSTVEVLGGLETVRSLDTTDFEVKRIESAAEKLRVKEILHHLQMAYYDAAKYLNEGLFYIIVICLSIYLASIGVITKGDILVYSILFLSVLNPLREIHRILDEAHESSIRVNDLYNLQALPKDRSYIAADITPISSITNDAINIDHLSYRYASRPEHPVLNDINLVIKKGEKIGIAGVSGGGKSTFVKILLRLQHDFEGHVTLLGNDLDTLNRKQLSQRIAYIPQRTYIFSGTIRENIVYGSGKSSNSDKAIIEAAKKAHIWDEVEQSLGGLDGKVTEQGNNLSGGQKQRIAIARIIFHAPEILIFDEATSALDNQNESDVQKMLEVTFADKTVITIAHRLSTLRNSDRILVFSQGKIAQEGNYKKLSSEDGIFKTFLQQK